MDVVNDDNIRFVKTKRVATLDDGIEIDESFAPGIPEVDVSKYGLHHVWVLLNNIRIMEKALREVDERHVESITESLVKNGLLKAAGAISVAMPEDMVFDRSTMSRQRDDGLDELMMEPLTCDGQHRVTGMNKATATDLEKEKEFEWIDAQVWYGKDDKPVSDLEKLGIGALLNDTSSKIRFSNFTDSIHATIAAFRMMKNRLDMQNQRTVMTVAGVTGPLMKLKVLVPLGARQYSRYAHLAQRLVEYDIE